MNNKCKKYLKFAIALLAALWLSVFNHTTFAMSEDEMYKEIMLNTLSSCVMAMKSEIDVSDYASFSESLLKDTATTIKVYIPTPPIGSSLGNKLEQSTSNGTLIDCKTFFMGDASWNSWFGGYGGSLNGMFKIFGKTTPNQNDTVEVKKNFLKSIGYTEEKSSSNVTQTCLTVKYTAAKFDGYPHKTIGDICWDNDVLSAKYESPGDLYDAMFEKAQVDYSNKSTDVGNPSIKLTRNSFDSMILSVSAKVVVPADDYHNSPYEASKFADIVSDMYYTSTAFNNDAWNSKSGVMTDSYDSEQIQSVFYVESSQKNRQGGKVTLEMKGQNEAYKALRKWFSGQEESRTFTDTEKYEFYMKYFHGVYNASISGTDCLSNKPSNVVSQNGNAKTYYVKTSSGWCPAMRSTSGSDYKVSGFATPDPRHSGSGRQILSTTYNFEGLIKELAKLQVDDSNLTAPSTSPSSASGTTNPPNQNATCSSAGGAQSLGWILCPALDVVAGATTTFYNNLVEPALQVSPQLFNGDENGGTFKGWTTFRNFANILFVIFLLVVIFSQLTGVGIDNYGIKKILPKLIVVAVLVNLSYFICQALVDLSNILGNSLQAFFESLDTGSMVDNLGGWGASDVGESVISTFAVTAVAAAIGGTAIWALVANGGGIGILISLILAIVSGLISLFFLFIILAARQVAIVVLVVISPLAILCYALPNTKSLFDKYKKFGENLLLVYPIAGLLVGGGNYVSRLLLSVGGGSDFFPVFTAMMAGIIPIFFIPKVLQGSFNMLGGLGARIASFGKNMGTKYTGAMDRGVKNTDRYKNYQGDLARRRKVNEAARTRRRINAIPEAQRTQRQKEQLMDADRVINEQTQRAAQAQVGVVPVTPTIAHQRAEASAQAQEFKNYSERNGQLTRSQVEGELREAVAAYSNDRTDANATRLMAAIAEAESRGMSKEMLAEETGLSGMELTGNNSTDARIINQLSNSRNKAISQYGKNRNKNADRPMSMREFVTGGIQGDNLQEAFAGKGSEVLHGMDDDTLSYLSRTNASALSTEQLISAATHTTNQKELNEINSMLSGRADYSMRTSDLASIRPDTLEALPPSVYERAIEELSDGSEASRKIIQNMNQESRDFLARQGHSIFATSSGAQTASASNGQTVDIDVNATSGAGTYTDGGDFQVRYASEVPTSTPQPQPTPTPHPQPQPQPNPQPNPEPHTPDHMTDGSEWDF